MRVISGSARGLKLKAPEGMNTRPTTDRIKESLFNILTGELYDINFLDLFSGSGGMAIEALSRGAKKAVLVDSDFKSIAVIKDNVKRARLEDKAVIMKSDVISAINRLGSAKEKFDIIFMDPPYKKGLPEPVLKAVFNNNLLNDDGFVIVEQAVDEAEIKTEEFNVFRIKEYKTTKMTFLNLNTEEV